MPRRLIARTGRGISVKPVTVILVLFALYIAWLTATRPSNDRDWEANFAVLPYAEFEGDLVHVYNIRNTSYTTPDVYEPAYYDRTFELSRLESVWYIVEPFSDWGGAAHTFVSFGFEGDRYLSISVETRKEKGESYHFVKGLLRQYELMYVVADERDVIKLRSNYRHDDVYVYPIKTTRAKIRELFVAMLGRANRLRKRPEHYNTLTNNCTSNIVKHVNSLTPRRIPFSLEVLFPGYSDRYAYDLGLLDTDLSFEAARERFKINARAEAYADSPDFSVRIRQ
jgi:hypothetical protein